MSIEMSFEGSKEAVLRSCGNLFQVADPAYEKARSPNSVRSIG